MDFANIVNHAMQTINLILLASLPSVLAAAIVGVLISLLQALTQVQEQTLGFAFKLIAVIAVLAATLEVVGANFYLFTDRLFETAGSWGS